MIKFTKEHINNYFNIIESLYDGGDIVPIIELNKFLYPCEITIDNILYRIKKNTIGSINIKEYKHVNLENKRLDLSDVPDNHKHLYGIPISLAIDFLNNYSTPRRNRICKGFKLKEKDGRYVFIHELLKVVRQKNLEIDDIIKNVGIIKILHYTRDQFNQNSQYKTVRVDKDVSVLTEKNANKIIKYYHNKILISVDNIKIKMSEKNNKKRKLVKNDNEQKSNRNTTLTSSKNSTFFKNLVESNDDISDEDAVVFAPNDNDNISEIGETTDLFDALETAYNNRGVTDQTSKLFDSKKFETWTSQSIFDDSIKTHELFFAFYAYLKANYIGNDDNDEYGEIKTYLGL